MNAVVKTQPVNILLVDDDPDFRQMTAFAFRRMGYRVFTARNGRDAFAIVESQSIDVVVSDIRMPGGDGVELLDRIRKNQFGVPIVLLVTGFAEFSSEEACSRGAEALIAKPLNVKDMESLIQRLLKSHGKGSAGKAVPNKTDLKVTLQFEGTLEAVEAQMFALDRDGVFLAYDRRPYPDVNEMIGLKVTFKDSDRLLNVNGVVRWIWPQTMVDFPAGCGIEFTYMSDADRVLLQRHLLPKLLE